jgi:threonylcarbamoyladenosine tRNA methylthiotransferase MtaB
VRERENRTMKFFIFTTGCKANQWDSHVIASNLKESGLSQAGLPAADLVIINACSLTGRAETDARRFIQRARQTSPAARIALVGCHAQAYRERDFGADLVLGQEEKFDPGRYLNELGRFVSEGRKFAVEKAPSDGVQRERTRFFFKIQDGCNKFCTYCVVPRARGEVRSRPADEIEAFMRSLKEKGIKEVVLTGIDVAAYRDPSSGMDLKSLLARFETMDTPPRIRLSSVDPEYIDDEFIGIMAASVKIARSIHIPVQSGCDAVLRAMGRRYGSDLVASVVERLTAHVGGIGIGMDIMVGFPGEDDEGFEQTYRFIEALDIFYLHVFPFSEREGTRACGIPGKVTEAVKKERVKRLRALDEKKRESFARRFIGEKLQVIPEGKVCKDGLVKGFSDNYLPVYLPCEKTLENNLVEVTIKGIQGSRLIGGY